MLAQRVTFGILNILDMWPAVAVAALLSVCSSVCGTKHGLAKVGADDWSQGPCPHALVRGQRACLCGCAVAHSKILNMRPVLPSPRS